MNEYVEQKKLKETVNSIYNGSITGQEIDRLDETITVVPNAARKYVEGVKSRMPSSRQKLKIRTTYLHYKVLVKKKERRNIDEHDLKGGREFLKIEREEITEENAEEKCAEELQNWEDHKKKVKQEREKELLEFCPS